jgi:2'-5' RNA ligase
MSFDPDGLDRINLFALVIYIPGPLGGFLDALRRELAPTCIPHAHVTILPPRPLSAKPEVACEAARILAAEFAPFELEAGEVEIFPATDVIYIGLRRGAAELREMHRALNTGPLAYQEPFPYHPHITLAQNLIPDQVQPLYAVARRRWAEFTGPRTFAGASAAFVQSTVACTWVDLAEISLGAVGSVR